MELCRRAETLRNDRPFERLGALLFARVNLKESKCNEEANVMFYYAGPPALLCRKQTSSILILPFFHQNLHIISSYTYIYNYSCARLKPKLLFISARVDVRFVVGGQACMLPMEDRRSPLGCEASGLHNPGCPIMLREVIYIFIPSCVY